MTNENSSTGQGKGFSGLSSMVSDVESSLDQSSHKHQPVEKQLSEPLQQPVQSAPNPNVKQIEVEAPDSNTVKKIIFGILGVVFLFWIFGSGSNNQSKQRQTTEPIYQPSASTTSEPTYTFTPLPQSEPVRPIEDLPPVGTDIVLSASQLRWCYAEKIRLDAGELVVNSYITNQVNFYNTSVNDYNSRCAQFRYKNGTLETAKLAVEAFRTEIENEGRRKFGGGSSATTPARSEPPKPDATVLAVQKRLNELGYQVGTPDGFAGKNTKLAITNFQKDNRLPLTGEASVSLLANLQSAKSAPVATSNPVTSSQSSPSQYSNQPVPQATRSSGMPDNAELDYYGRDWVCKRGYRKVGNACPPVDVPVNAELDYYGHDWTCKRGYRKVGNACPQVDVPVNAELDYYGHDWTCRKGFKRVGSGCLSVDIPMNAELDYYGHDWTCKRGYRKVGNACPPVDVPVNAELDYYGHDWTCKRGYRKVGNACPQVDVPVNAELDYYGHDWTCMRGYRKVGNQCFPI